jgi:integral membrane protein (TIGR01906 family)
MSNFSRKILRTLTIFLIPLIIILGMVRLLATDAYLAYEYGKPSFPPDTYGFTAQQRFILASTNIHYVRAHLPDNELSKQILNGSMVYNEREVAHMADVQAVFQLVLRVWQFALILLIFLEFVLWKKGEQTTVTAVLRDGGLLTSGIILTIGLLAIFAWQAWFEMFHRLFFEDGSWLFFYTDALIRLFPIEFWFDSVITLSILSLVAGLALALLSWRGQTALTRFQEESLGTH